MNKSLQSVVSGLAGVVLLALFHDRSGDEPGTGSKLPAADLQPNKDVIPTGQAPVPIRPAAITATGTRRPAYDAMKDQHVTGHGALYGLMAGIAAISGNGLLGPRRVFSKAPRSKAMLLTYYVIGGFMSGLIIKSFQNDVSMPGKRIA